MSTTFFTLFDTDSGQVLFGGSASDPKQFVESGQSLLVGRVFEDGYMQDGEHFQLPEQPSPHHVFDYTTKQWVDPRTDQTQWPVVRSQRNSLLSASDWTQLPDVPLATKEAWAIYRQALRDVTMQSDPFAIVWPLLPEQ